MTGQKPLAGILFPKKKTKFGFFEFVFPFVCFAAEIFMIHSRVRLTVGTLLVTRPGISFDVATHSTNIHLNSIKIRSICVLVETVARLSGPPRERATTIFTLCFVRYVFCLNNNRLWVFRSVELVACVLSSLFRADSSAVLNFICRISVRGLFDFRCV